MPGNFTFFTQQIENDIAVFDENETRHALVTLRYQKGDKIDFTDGLGFKYEGEIISAEKRHFSATIQSKNLVGNKPEFILVCGIIKSGDRMEWMVEKCTELGVGTLFFVKCGNSERATINREKLKKTAVAALKQCHGTWLPQIEEISWRQAMELAGDKCMAAITSDATPINRISPPQICLIGPEGDFTARELEEALAAGYQPVSLGNNVLRTETAALAVAAFFALQ